jgi:NADH:ubiquinone oxidoreductase subunit 6 (subunit J)
VILALIVYVFAVVTVFSIIRGVTDRNHEYANDLFLMLAVVVAVFWPLYVPTTLLVNVVHWITAHRGEP